MVAKVVYCLQGKRGWRGAHCPFTKESSVTYSRCFSNLHKGTVIGGCQSHKDYGKVIKGGIWGQRNPGDLHGCAVMPIRRVPCSSLSSLRVGEGGAGAQDPPLSCPLPDQLVLVGGLLSWKWNCCQVLWSGSVEVFVNLGREYCSWGIASLRSTYGCGCGTFSWWLVNAGGSADCGPCHSWAWGPG